MLAFSNEPIGGAPCVMDSALTSPVPLRGHHLFCLQFFHGTGYSADFARNMMHIMEDFRDQEFIVVEGHDVVCSHCPRRNNEQAYECALCPQVPGGIEGLDAYARDLIGVEIGDVMAGADIAERTEQRLDDWRERACRDCTWRETCAAVMSLVARPERI